jgi:uncharacterized protein
VPERHDPFEVLRRPHPPLAPHPLFAASLRRRVEQELGMSQTTATVVEGALGLVHFRVADSDRAMRFFGALLGWEGERVEFGDLISHYTVNTQVTVRLLEDPAAPPVVPNYHVAEVADTIRRIERAGGTVTQADPAPDGGGWARGHDDQGLPLLVFRPGRHYAHAPASRPPSGEVGLVFIRADSARAARFYEAVLGWHLERVHPDSWYFEAVPRVGVFDEAAAFGTATEPSTALYLAVPALAPVLAEVERLGGRHGPVAHDMGPYFTAMCTDDQGTPFGLMSLSAD